MSAKIYKFVFRFLLGFYAYFLIHLVGPTLIILGLIPFFLQIPFLNILLGIGVILLEGYIFLWKVPWFLYEKSGFKKRYYPILPITSIITIPFFSFLYFPQYKPSVNTYQKEASSQLVAYVKASQAFFTEHNQLAKSTKDIGEYISVTGCKTNDARICRKSDLEDYSELEITKWFLRSGNYEIEMKSDNDQNIFVATPTGKIKRKGLGVSGCFNSKNGTTRVWKMDNKGPNVEIANCDDLEI